MSFFSFLIEYYIWIMIVLILLIVTVIGFLVDNSKKNLTNNKSNSLQDSSNKTDNSSSNGNSSVSFDDIFSQDEKTNVGSQSMNSTDGNTQKSTNIFSNVAPIGSTNQNVSHGVSKDDIQQSMSGAGNNLQSSGVTNGSSNAVMNSNSIFSQPVVSGGAVGVTGTQDVSQYNVGVNSVNSQPVVSQNGLSSIFTTTDTQQSNHTDIFSNDGRA